VSDRSTLDAWLHAAYADPDAGCPPPEAFLEAKLSALAPAERRRLEQHAERCAACAAERDLARLFDQAPEIAGVRPEDLDYVTARLAAASPVAGAAPAATGTAAVDPAAPRTRREEPPSGAQVIRFPGPTPAQAPVAAPAVRTARRAPARSWPLARLAAAAMLVLAAGLGFQLMRPEPPALPAPQAGQAVRGATIEILSPLGELAEPPSELRWAPWNDAAGYRVRILEVDGTTLWEERVPAAAAVQPGTPAETVSLPGEVRARLQRAVTYRWTVEALGPAAGPDPARLAVSEPAELRIRP
jgi:hypothetical protein